MFDIHIIAPRARNEMNVPGTFLASQDSKCYRTEGQGEGDVLGTSLVSQDTKYLRIER